MKHLIRTVLLILLLAVVPGCGNHQLGDIDMFGKGGSSRNFESVSGQRLFAASKKVLSGYYKIKSSDPAAGKIVTFPASVNDEKMFLKRSPARHFAELAIVSDGTSSTVRVNVIQERQYTRARSSYAQVSSAGNYSENPGKESTLESARVYWTRERSRGDIENQILADIAEELATKRIK